MSSQIKKFYIFLEVRAKNDNLLNFTCTEYTDVKNC